MNRKLTRNATIMALCVLFAIASNHDVLAQARKAGGAQSAAKADVVVKKVEMAKTKSPDYSSSINEVTITPGDWTKVLVRFDTDAEWTDQLEMRFYIVVKNAKTAAYTMFTGTYVYSDIPKGRGHQVAVFLRPRTTERYGLPE